jgi:type IV pilus assembly protein PilQ
MKVIRVNHISISRKRWLASAVLFVFSASCATSGVSTNRTPQQSLSDPSLPVGSSAARVVDITEPPVVGPVELAEREAPDVKPTVPAIVVKPAADIDQSPTLLEQTGPTTSVAPPAKKAAVPEAIERPSREAADTPGRESLPSPAVAVNQPTLPTPAMAPPTVANKRLSLDFKGADLDDLLRLISDVSGLNIVVAHGMKDRKDRDVTVRLNNIEWRQALDVILRAKGLSYEQDGNLIYVGSKNEIQKNKEERAKDIEQTALKELRIEEEKRKVQEARRKVEDERRRTEEEERRYAQEPACTRVIRLAYVKASEVRKHLERLKTRRGHIDLDETTNSLIVNDLESACQKMATLAKELDTPPKEPFVTRLLPFNYAKATDLKTHLNALKTKDGSVIVDERSSRIIVKDLPEAVERMEAFLKQIDIPTPQVLIEARIVEATRKFSQSFGIQWGGTGIPTSAGSATGATVFGGGGAGSIQFPNLTSPAGNPFPATGGGVPFMGPVPLAMNLPVTSPHFAIGMTIGSLANRFLVGAQLSVAENQGKIRTLSSPRVATQDNEEAEIKQGTQVPYTTIDASGRTVVQFQDAFIKLKVKPHITPDGRVAMKVEAERSFPGQQVTFTGGFVFPINTRKATTNIMVQNGSTVVIGGLLQSSETIITDQVPALGDIPIIGWLFKRRAIGPDERVELLIFLTPSVLQESRL